jgi:hypothetical protein
VCGWPDIVSWQHTTVHMLLALKTCCKDASKNTQLQADGQPKHKSLIRAQVSRNPAGMVLNTQHKETLLT